MRLFVGLGNPGSKYANNRHNIGFMAVDEIARRHGFAPWRRRFQGETSEGTLDREKVVLLRPTTYMNESGRAVQEAANFFKLAPPTSPCFRTNSNCRRRKCASRSAAASPVITGCARSPRISATTTAGCGSGSVIPASRSWCTATCCRILPRATGRGWKRCARRSPTMPGCWRRARIRRSRTRCIWRCRPRDFSTEEAGDAA